MADILEILEKGINPVGSSRMGRVGRG
jgi:hypothetical protein